MRIIDTHTHFIPTEFLDLLEGTGGPTGIRLEERPGDQPPMIIHDNGLRYPALDVFTDPQARIGQLDEEGYDMAVISFSPSLFGYWLDPDETIELCQVVNSAAARIVAEHPSRIQAMATVPLNAPEAAAAELERASELGLTGVQIGTSVGDRQLDDPALEPFFDAAERVGHPVVLHPYLSMTDDVPVQLQGFHLSNVVGNPTETYTAASRLTVGGVFDRHPGLRVGLVHGGGTFPFQLGRLDHAYRVRDETSSVISKPPMEYLENFFFDTVLFSPEAQRFLIDLAGPSRVVFGTDLPFDMGDTSGVSFAGTLDDESRDLILGGNACRLFGIDAESCGDVRTTSSPVGSPPRSG